MPRPKVLLDVPMPGFLAELFDDICEFRPWELLLDNDPELSDVDALLTYAHPRVGDAELDRTSGLKVISNFGVGVDHIDLQAARRHGIPVGNTPGTVDGATADATFALILSVARNVIVGDRFARGPEFKFYDPGILLGRDVFGATLGIIGLGRIGEQVAQRAQGFGMRILYYNRNPKPEAERLLGVVYTPLDELLGQADYVSLNTPLTPETNGLIGARELALMKPTAFLINTARGGVVDTDSLLQALSEGWIGGAGIDVTEPEPLPRDHPLLELDNLVLLPHLGTATVETRLKMAQITAQNLVAGLTGTALVHEVMACVRRRLQLRAEPPGMKRND